MFWNYLIIGFKHVIPLGYDHILFILALFFFNSKLKTAVVQCSVFTVAHSFTLILSAMGYLHFGSRWVEAGIAFSIFFVAFENVFQSTVKPWRVALVFFFGLVHGMGFASALNNAGLPQHDFLSAVIAFNCGVELAQLAIILCCYLMVARRLSEKNWYQQKLAHPVSIAISCVALFWSVERVLEIQ